MAVTSVILDIKANTDRALNDFKRFSSQLDNKFLVSGLKLDVVRSALGQINREFQRAIGEQGLQAGQSLRAAQNQAALLLDTFKSVGPEAAESITQQFSSAFSEIAIKAGGTAKDIQKALSATPFISTNLSKDMRSALAQGVMDFQRDFRRAGFGDEYATIIREFLAGQVTAGELSNSADPLRSRLGLEFQRLGGTPDLLGTAEARSRVISQFQQSRELRETLNRMMDRANYGQFIIEDLNARLFNPERGVFGVLRQVTMSVTDKTTIFRETRALIDSVFGRQGLFANFFSQVAKIFGLEDPLKLIIIGVRFITKQFDVLNKFVQSPEFQNIVTFVKEIFTRTKDFFTELYNQVTAGTFDKQSIITQIKAIGETVRSYIKRIGDMISGEDISKEADFGTSIVGTLVEELGKTLVALIRDIGGALLPKAGQIALGLTGALIKALGGIIGAVFSNLLTGTLATAAGGFLAYKGLRAVGGVVGGIRSARNSPGGMLGAVDRHFGSPFRVGSNSISPGEARVMGFHSQVIARMDAIIRILAGGGATDIDYGGERSPIDGGPRRGGGGSGRRGIRGRTQYPGSIGPLPTGSVEPWAFDGDEFQPYLDTNRTDARGRSLRQRINSRYGSGGGRALLARRFRGFGRGALIAGGIGLAGAALFGGGSAQAAEMDPSTGEPRVSTGEAFGRVGMGAAEGALTGAMFGPWGAAIGAAIGGGVALFDKGVRDAIGKSIVKFGSDSLKWLDGLRKGFLDNMMKAFDGIKNFTSNIDWGNLILDVIFPGRGLARSIAEAAGVRPSGQNGGGIFDQVKDALASFFGIRREVGGPVIKGTSYIVGERGPEIFTPGQTGTISSNRELMALGSRGYGGSSVSANFNIAINVNGNMGAGDVEALRAPVLAIVEEAWASATQGTVSRGALA